jgi:5-methylcytosine-specific restriction protein A
MPWPTTSRHARGYGRDHERIREQLLREVILCEHCTAAGRTTAGVIADHIVPLARGGKTERSNYQLLCRACSNLKTAQENGRTLRKRPRIGLDGWPIDG